MNTERIVKDLWNIFGGHINEKGYKVLHQNVRIIQGDGIDNNTLRDILENFKTQGFAASNIAFGSGGGILQRHDRDEYKFAFKCCYAQVNGEERDVRKRPMEFKPDGRYIQSNKTSKAGRLALTKRNGSFETVDERDIEDSENMLECVFENGVLFREERFEDVRNRTRS